MAKRPGKYAHVVNTLPKFPGDDPERRELIERVKAEIIAPPNEEDLHIQDVRVTVENLEKMLKVIISAEKRAAAGKLYASEFARIYAELRWLRDRIGTWDDSVGLLLEAYQVLMAEQMENEGISSLTLSNGQPVSTYLEPYAQIVDKEAHRLWAVDQGLERQMVLPWATSNSLAKQMLLAGEPEPPGIKIFAKTKVRLGSE